MAISAHHGSKKQRGTALIVSLLILLVLTILGVAAMSTTTMEEKMAGNSRKIDLAFQSAESALRDAQTDPAIKNDLTAFDSTCTNGLCLP
ncbi:MAG TPA: PilX protein, partial [Actinobacteria bacterium]|nr:PilX protein [Actinomycetota bacterium]